MIDQTAQRTMQVPGQGIVPQGRPTMDHKEYPKMMTHPQFQPGKPGPEIKSPHGFTYHTGGTPIRFPPVLVRTPDQEEYHKSLGYETLGKSDPDAFNRAVGAGQIPDHVAYVPLEYPKWVLGKMVHSREEEDRLTGAQPAPALPETHTEVKTLLDRPDIAETREEKLARLKREVAELEQPEGIVTRKPKAPKKARKKVVRTAQQKRDHSEAIRAGLARKRERDQLLTESELVEESVAVPDQ